jgi:hypothetical protein
MVHESETVCINREVVTFRPPIRDQNFLVLINSCIYLRARCDISTIELGSGCNESQYRNDISAARISSVDHRPDVPHFEVSGTFYYSRDVG